MNSIKDGINATTICVDIRLQRQQHKGSFLLVEGENDKNLFTGFCDTEDCSIVVCLGRERLLAVVAELYGENFSGVLGFADRDFVDMVPRQPFRGDVVFTDENDMEIMILCSSAFDKVTGTYGRADKVGAAEVTASMSAREMVFQSASAVGTLRLLAQQKGWPLVFDEMKYQFTRTNSYCLDDAATVRHVLARSKATVNMKEDEIIDVVRNRESLQVQVKRLCNGHDCVRVLGRALKTVFGNMGQFNSGPGASLLEGALRLAYDLRYFSRTKAYREIREWEARAGYKVLNSVQ